MQSSDLPDTRKLVRCSVLNADEERSVRLIEFKAYRMWEYLVTHKHGLKVEAPELCLWVSKPEFDENLAIYERSGEIEAVNCVLVDIFDAEYGFSHVIERYALDAETQQVIDILGSHIPAHITEDACTFSVRPGVVIQQWHHVQRRPAILGLQG